MNKFKNFEQFVNEQQTVNEGTIEGYKYRFDFEGKQYIIHQGSKDKTLFGIKGKESGWSVLTKGDTFDAQKNGMELKEFVAFLQKGIKYFNIRETIDVEIVKESEWAKYFDFEIKKKPGRINKKYVILKLHCGKAQAKYLANH